MGKFIKDELTGIQKIIHFFNLWYENRHNVKDFLLFTYENLHRDTEKAFQEMLSFMGIETDKQAITDAVEQTRFDKMKKMESSGNLKEPWMKPGSEKSAQSMKVRKGKMGSYKDELAPADIDFINDYMQKHLHPDLKKLYDLPDDG